MTPSDYNTMFNLLVFIAASQAAIIAVVFQALRAEDKKTDAEIESKRVEAMRSEAELEAVVAKCQKLSEDLFKARDEAHIARISAAYAATVQAKGSPFDGVQS